MLTLSSRVQSGNSVDNIILFLQKGVELLRAYAQVLAVDDEHFPFYLGSVAKTKLKHVSHSNFLLVAQPSEIVLEYLHFLES